MKQYNISKDKLRWIRHDVIGLHFEGTPHPLNELWKERGIEHVVEAIPEPIGDCWMILVKNWDKELAEYEDELELEPNEKYWADFKIKIVE